MAIINSVFTWFMQKRLHQIKLFEKFPCEVQKDELKKLLSSAENTEIGKKYKFASITCEKEFKEALPLRFYEDIQPEIDRIQKGEQNILWGSEIKWLAKSSGTTNDKSKFIPVSYESLENCHYKGGKDMFALYINNNPQSELFSGMNLAMGGSLHIQGSDTDISYGDVSAIIMSNLPFWAEFKRVPSIEIALMSEWEAKIEKIAESTMNSNVTNIAGVPSWTLVLLKKILEKTGKDSILDVWPNFEVFFHGGVSFTPYKKQFENIIYGPTKKSDKTFHFMELYNASEGFFAIQDSFERDDMLLMLDYGVYYEFIPLDEIDNPHPSTLNLEDVELGKNYALVISTNAGLWRYIIGDTIQFTSRYPYRIKISGRTKNFINTFGEEVIIDNAEKALEHACSICQSSIKEYTAGPVYLDERNQACHQWLIEFEKEPEQLDYFCEVLDNALKAANSDYEAKRYKNILLKMPIITSLPSGTFYKWLKTKGKLGGQHKIPRLYNSRQYIDEILALSRT